MNIKIPYGKGFEHIELSGSFELLETDIPQTSEIADNLVKAAMAKPIGSPTLSRLASGKNSAVIILSDHTRPVPSRFIIPHMLSELRQGNPEINITLLVATGCHRETTLYELTDKLGQDIISREKIIVHDCRDEASLVNIGRMPSGAELIINRLAVETDLLLAEGFIEPHFFAGFSGGRKSVMPGICSEKTVLGNHCSEFIASPYARTGILDNNPIHIDMVEAVKLANFAYIVNVILDSDKNVVAAYAGNPIDAHEAGCQRLMSFCRVRPKRKGDIIITSNGGYPLDQNIYQAVKGMTAAEAAANEGAVIIICAKCGDGIGGQHFYEALRSAESPESLMNAVLATPMEQTKPDQWQYQILARVLMKHRVIFVADESVKEYILQMKMDYAPSLFAAYEQARNLKPTGHTLVIPDGVGVIVEQG